MWCSTLVALQAFVGISTHSKTHSVSICPDLMRSFVLIKTVYSFDGSLAFAFQL